MKTRNLGIITFVSILLASSIFLPLYTESSFSNSTLIEQEFVIDNMINIDIILVDYIENIDLINSLKSKLPSVLHVNSINFPYILNYSFIFPDTSYKNEFNGFIDSIANASATTATLNMTALTNQASNFKTEDIFLPQSGTAINGLSVEEWLWNKTSTIASPISSYQIYLLNFSRFDNGTDQHWFEIPEIDSGSQRQRQSWRLEWDLSPESTYNNVNNYDAKFPYPGYSSNHPLYLLDPYAHQWYLNWTRVWRSVPDDAEHIFYSKSLGNYLQTLSGLTSTEILSVIGNYSGSWLNEIIRNDIFFSPFSLPKLLDTLKVEIAIFTDDTVNKSYPDLNWILNSSLINEELARLLPTTQISIETSMQRLENHSLVNSILQGHLITPFSNETNPIPNYRYYDGNSLFTNIISVDSLYFNNSNADITIRGYIFILDNASFAPPSLNLAPWGGGGLYTGLGGEGRILILNEVDRLFFNRTSNPVRKDSILKVITHEIGHAVGLPHPFKSGSYGSDFIGGAMGYYPSTYKYSSLFLKAYQRYIVDNKLPALFQNIENTKGLNLPAFYVDEAYSLYQALISAYQALNFDLVISYIEDLQAWLDNIINILEPIIESPIFTETPFSQVLLYDVVNQTTLHWIAIDQTPFIYILYRNGTEIANGTWISSEIISYNLGNHKPGFWVYKMVFYDAFGLNATHQVIIQIPEPPAPPPPTKGIINISLGTPFLAILILFGSIIFIREMRK